jgi:hypothetical protein
MVHQLYTNSSSSGTPTNTQTYKWIWNYRLCWPFQLHHFLMRSVWRFSCTSKWNGKFIRVVPSSHRKGSQNLDPASFTIIMWCMIIHASMIYQGTLLLLKSSGSSHNSELGLQNLKCSNYIFPSRRLCIKKIKLFLTLGFNNHLHNCAPPRQESIHSCTCGHLL